MKKVLKQFVAACALAGVMGLPALASASRYSGLSNMGSLPTTNTNTSSTNSSALGIGVGGSAVNYNDIYAGSSTNVVTTTTSNSTSNNTATSSTRPSGKSGGSSHHSPRPR